MRLRFIIFPQRQMHSVNALFFEAGNQETVFKQAKSTSNRHSLSRAQTFEIFLRMKWQYFLESG